MSETTRKVAVVTPYYREPTEMLRQCHDSVLAQAVPGAQVDHLLIADGFANPALQGWRARHVVLPDAHGDNGNTPRSVGSLLADAEGYDFIAYLDADNWFHPGHLQSLLALQEAARVPVACAWRSFHRLDGTELQITEADENACIHVDTSCYLLQRSAFACLAAWHRMPKALSPLCDRIFFRVLQHGRYAMAFSGRRTVAFRSQYAVHYRAAGEPPPADAKPETVFEPCKQYLVSAQGIQESVERLGFWPGA